MLWQLGQTNLWNGIAVFFASILWSSTFVDGTCKYTVFILVNSGFEQRILGFNAVMDHCVKVTEIFQRHQYQC